MPYPTTRYERYVFLRNRAIRRAKRVWARGGGNHEPGVITTGRFFDYAWCGKMTEKGRSPKNAISPRPDGYFDTPPSVKPANGVAPVKTSQAYQDMIAELGYHFRREVFEFQRRRVLSLPPLHMLAKKPWRGPLPGVHDRAGYPYLFYPSGRFNPRGWKSNEYAFYENPPGYEGFINPPVVAWLMVATWPIPNNVPPEDRPFFPWANWDNFPYIPLLEEPMG